MAAFQERGLYGSEWWLTDPALAARAIDILGADPAPDVLAEWIEGVTGREPTPEQVLAVLMLLQQMPAAIEATTHLVAGRNAGGDEPLLDVVIKVDCECRRRKLPKHFPPCRRAGEAITYSEPPRVVPGHKQGGHKQVHLKHHGRR